MHGKLWVLGLWTFVVASRFNTCICSSSSRLCEYHLFPWTVKERNEFWYPCSIIIETCNRVLCDVHLCDFTLPWILGIAVNSSGGSRSWWNLVVFVCASTWLGVSDVRIVRGGLIREYRELPTVSSSSCGYRLYNGCWEASYFSTPTCCW